MAAASPIDVLELERIAIAAGARAFSAQTSLVVASDNSSVEPAYEREKQAFSKLDEEIQLLIIAELHRLDPTLTILAEEADAARLARDATDTSELFKHAAIIDPIDGTRNFLRGEPYWGVSIALVENGALVAGAIAYPGLACSLRVGVGGGVFLNGEQIQFIRRVYDTKDMVRVSGAMPHVQEVRSKFPLDEQGTGSFVITLLGLLRANGVDVVPDEVPQYFAYIGENTLVHDTGCAPLVWTEAGGAVVGVDGQPCELLSSAVPGGRGLVITKRFVFAADKSYADAILARLLH